jgi:putative flippase GtrA
MAVFNIELFRFLFVGVGSNLISYAIYLFFYSIGIPLFAASAAGYVVGTFFSYHFGRIWVFGRKFEVSKNNVIRFLAVYSIGGLGMISIIELMARTLGVDYRASWLVGAIFAVISNYLGQKKLVFNEGVSK